MTSEFAIAVHALVYLNHKQETLASEELAKNIMDDIYGQLNEVCREKLRRITIADIDNKIFHREER